MMAVMYFPDAVMCYPDIVVLTGALQLTPVLPAADY